MRSFQGSNLFQQFGRREQPKSKALAPAKVVFVERNDSRTVARHCDFKYHVVVRISQERTPNEVDLVGSAHPANVAENVIHIAAADRQIVEMSQSNALVFQMVLYSVPHMMSIRSTP